MGLNCNARINNIEGSNHNNNAIACNNNNLNANHSYSLFHLMCARVARACACVHVHYARVRVRRGLWGDKGGCTIYELQLNNISEKSSDYCLTTQSLSSTRALVLFYSNYEIV